MFNVWLSGGARGALVRCACEFAVGKNDDAAQCAASKEGAWGLFTLSS